MNKEREKEAIALFNDYEDFCRGCIEELWMKDRLIDSLSMQECFDARKIILSGNGLGHAAAVSAFPVFQANCDIFFGTEIMDQAEFNYFNNVEAMGIGEPRTPLVLLASESEDDKDCEETLKIVNKVGANSLLICAGKNSKQEAIANNVLYLGLDKEDRLYMAKAFLGMVIALCALAYRIGRVRGTVSELDVREVKEEMLSYIASIRDHISEYAEAAEDFAAMCGDNSCFDYIADAEAKGTAEACGVIGARKQGYRFTVNDSEEWCHVNYWMEDRFNLCTIMLGFKDQPSFSRILETMGCVNKLERPYLFVTDAEPEEFLEGTRCLRIPEPPKGKRWFSTFASFIPAVLAVDKRS